MMTVNVVSHEIVSVMMNASELDKGLSVRLRRWRFDQRSGTRRRQLHMETWVANSAVYDYISSGSVYTRHECM